jgi:hypothetical protein
MAILGSGFIGSEARRSADPAFRMALDPGAIPSKPIVNAAGLCLISMMIEPVSVHAGDSEAH